MGISHHPAVSENKKKTKLDEGEQIFHELLSFSPTNCLIILNQEGI